MSNSHPDALVFFGATGEAPAGGWHNPVVSEQEPP